MFYKSINNNPSPASSMLDGKSKSNNKGKRNSKR